MDWRERSIAFIEDVILEVGTSYLDELETTIRERSPFAAAHHPDGAKRTWRRLILTYMAQLRSAHAKTPDDAKYFWVPKPAEKIAEEAADELIEWRQSIADEKEINDD